MIARERGYIYTLAFVYSALIVVLVSIPALFYLNVEKTNYRRAQQQKLEQYAYGLEKSIYDFSRTGKRIYDFPRSVLYDAHLYDIEGKLIFATDRCGRGLRDFSTPGIIAKTLPLEANRLGAAYLVVAQPFSYWAIYVKMVIGVLFLGVGLFLMNLFFIRISLRPLKRANRYLNTFFNDAMHELKTPLGVMQLNLEMLGNDPSSKPLMRLRNGMHNLTMIYEDIEYHIKHDHIDYRPERIDLAWVLQERIDLFRPLADARSIGIEVAIVKGVFVWINRIELQRIVDNTLSNAIKYSGRDTTIRIMLESTGSSVTLCCADEGVGIADTRRIFERYRREDTVQGGFGLGLNIVKHICDKNGIGIDVKSVPGEGSTFCYRFHKMD